MQLKSKYNKEIRALFCVADISKNKLGFFRSKTKVFSQFLIHLKGIQFCKRSIKTSLKNYFY